MDRHGSGERVDACTPLPPSLALFCDSGHASATFVESVVARLNVPSEQSSTWTKFTFEIMFFFCCFLAI